MIGQKQEYHNQWTHWVIIEKTWVNANKAYKYHLYHQASTKQQTPFAELLLTEQPKQRRLQSLQYPKKSVATKED